MPNLTAEQKSVIRRALKVARAEKASPREEKALVEALGVESTYRVLPYGDRDSVGALQQRPSQGWGPASESLETDVRQFLSAARKANSGGGSAGQLAQAVQRSGFPGRYDERAGEASQILQQYGVGGGGAAAPADGTRTATTPGVDNSLLRKQLVGQFLQQGGVNNQAALLQLAGSYGQAADVPGTTTTTKRAPRAKRSPSTSASGKPGSQVLELIFNDGGKGYGIKNGQTVDGASTYSAVWAGHANHVHVAAGPKTVVALGKLAQSMGLHVGENSHFGGENPASHVAGSYHNKDEAIDVSGDEAKMRAFAKRVAAYNHSKRLPS